MGTLILIQFAFLLLSKLVDGHLPSYASTPSVHNIVNTSTTTELEGIHTACLEINKIEQFCMLADSCLHDTIPVCGQMGDEKRSFLDLCDLLEFACDTNQIYSHIEDIPGCPIFKDPKIGK